MDILPILPILIILGLAIFAKHLYDLAVYDLEHYEDRDEYGDLITKK
jgi:hypothetical protein